MDEVDLDPIDLGRELWERVQPRFEPPEVIVARPVARELLQRRQLDPLRPICDELLGGPAHCSDAPAQVVDLLLWNLDVEGFDLVGGVDGAAHDDLLATAASGTLRAALR